LRSRCRYPAASLPTPPSPTSSPPSPPPPPPTTHHPPPTTHHPPTRCFPGEISLAASFPRMTGSARLGSALIISPYHGAPLQSRATSFSNAELCIFNSLSQPRSISSAVHRPFAGAPRAAYDINDFSRHATLSRQVAQAESRLGSLNVNVCLPVR
jgi:hypothetical protein